MFKTFKKTISLIAAFLVFGSFTILGTSFIFDVKLNFFYRQFTLMIAVN